MGVCVTTEQMAEMPQEPGQGSRHFSLIQAKFEGQSALIVHSGLQFGGEPIYPVTHEQEAC